MTPHINGFIKWNVQVPNWDYHDKTKWNNFSDQDKSYVKFVYSFDHQQEEVGSDCPTKKAERERESLKRSHLRTQD